MQMKVGNSNDITIFGDEVEGIFFGNRSDMAIFGEEVEGVFVVAGWVVTGWVADAMAKRIRGVTRSIHN